MLNWVLLALFLLCVGMTGFIIVYMCLLWYTATLQSNVVLPVISTSEKGLSSSELDKLPKITGKELVTGTECAICLDEIEKEQPARLVPGCNHAFHMECINTWLSKQPLCPLCRAKLDPEFFSSSQNPC